MTPPLLELADIHVAYGDAQVLHGLSLEVQDGETMVIIGYSGTGKSVALKHIVGLLHPDEGDVLVDGRAVSTLERAALNELCVKWRWKPMLIPMPETM